MHWAFQISKSQACKEGVFYEKRKFILNRVFDTSDQESRGRQVAKVGEELIGLGEGLGESITSVKEAVFGAREFH